MHGPLLAQRMIDAARARLGDRFSFAYRAVAPVFHFEAFEVCVADGADGLDLWVRVQDGRLAMTGTARAL